MNEKLPHVFISYKSEERAQANAMRKILLDEKIPVMIQGSPLIYAIEPETFALFRKSLTAKEPVP